MKVPVTDVNVRGTYRLIASSHAATGILDRIASPEDLEAVLELEGWTDDRISAELDILHRVPREEWVTGQPMATLVMGAFCHPHPEGGRFNTGERGAWYATRSLETAHAEVIYHRTRELEEVGVFDTFVHVRAYLADFRGPFHDIRDFSGAVYSKTSYVAAQKLASRLLSSGSNGLIYRSVVHRSGECIVCFRPSQVRNPRAGGLYEYRWSGTRTPTHRRIG